ncbi:hypothetical protein OAT67_02190 [Bacteriovoracaceae bacterium]|nr:hypothetical protein [Bacteriovoracaceae bacterium]
MKPTTISMLKVSLGDVILTWIAYLAVSLFSKSLSWGLQTWNASQWVTLSISAVALSVFMELHALETGRWWYTSINPVIYGRISVIPILQLVFLFPTSIKLSKYLYFRFHKDSGWRIHE